MPKPPARLAVFIDHQNTYMEARRCFHGRWDDYWCGQFDPLKLGLHLEGDTSPDYPRTLTQVRVYRGMPGNAQDPKGYGAARRQVQAWQASDPRVAVIARPLRYPNGWPEHSQPGEKPQEKGIDVALAVDFVAMAQRKEFDVGVLLSLDTDLKPALEHVADLARAWGKPRAEVAAWSAPDTHNGRLSITQSKLHCHWMNEDVYKRIQDCTDYTSKR